MMIRNLSVFGIFVGSFIAGCGSAPGREPGCPAVPAEILSGVDTVVPDSVRMRAVLRYDSVSFVVLENRSRLPVACRSGYRFEQWVGNRWKTVPVREKDTAWVFLPPGKTDTSFFRLERDLGYAPLGLCRIGKTVKVLSVPWQTFELRCEAEARPGKIDWNRMELVPDNRVADTLFVDMKVVSVEKDAVLVTLRNKSDRELVFGDYTDCSFCRYEDGKWLKISYASVIHSVAVMLTPGDTLSGWKHFLPKRLYAFPPGRYRVVKPFFFSGGRTRYFAMAEFVLDSLGETDVRKCLVGE